MPLQRFEDYKITISLPPLNGLSREACVNGVEILITSQQVIMNVSVSYVDGIGAPLEIPGLNSYSRSLCAGMDTIVDMKTGAILCDISELEIDGEPNLALTGADYGYQFEFMMSLMQQNVNIKDLILLNLQQAVKAGKFD